MNRKAIRKVVCPASVERCRNVEAAILPLSRDRLCLAYTNGQKCRFDRGDVRIMMKQSSDGGETWSQPTLLHQYDGKPNAMEPSFLRLPSGRILQTFQKRDGDLSEDQRFGDMSLMACFSDDECRSWTEPVDFSGPGNVDFTSNDRLLLLDDGRIGLPVLVAPEMTRVRLWLSDDGGQSWSPGRGCVAASEGERFGYPAAVELADGTVAMFLLSTAGRMQTAHSYDRGETWTLVSAVTLAPCSATFMVRRIPDSADLLAVWNNHPERTQLTSAISQDHGATWVHFRLLEPQHSSPAARTHAFPSVAFAHGWAHMTWYENYAHPQTETMFDLVYRREPIKWFYADSE